MQNQYCPLYHTLQQDIWSMPIPIYLCSSLVTSASGSWVLLRRKKWRCDKHSSGDVACKHQSFGRCAVSKLAVYSPRPSHTPLSGLRLIACRLPYEEQLIHTESNCKRTECRAEKVEETEHWREASGGSRRKISWSKRKVSLCGLKHFQWDQNSVKKQTSESLLESHLGFNWDKVSAKAHRLENKWWMREARAKKARENWPEWVACDAVEHL